MNELLTAIENLKRAYKASGVGSVKIELDGGDTKCILINKQKYALENIQKKPQTNGEWLRGLSDEELAEEVGGSSCAMCKYSVWNENGTGWHCAVDGDWDRCEEGALAWLRAEHKGVE